MNLEERVEAEARVGEVAKHMDLVFVGDIDSDGRLRLDGSFNADELRRLADAMEDNEAVSVVCDMYFAIAKLPCAVSDFLGEDLYKRVQKLISDDEEDEDVEDEG